ncbi:biotin-independent malonate decarboxylase subunit beta [Polynucleobacter sp. JS-JIR-5-A7]|jgi:malonate decarboxylase beta subunit|uniref:biotin-independent malonate decarboxylase subunit beta n=1 Tax=Polynucleobacter sp. JS-JIR-5-A7 TaxID=1758395 RepID=UPI001BFDCFED|nr:biotin-independent malonate decarboxylase subunit beta [Polynucleobacter sp. JS-JIR-5-A7]QWE07173.1 biotin-independent malonate decarboxylase subunit beta [Polynucleobacter sp. JS-JIR-5-A7]
MKIENTIGIRESTARQRVLSILDNDTFKEYLPPSDRVFSPHLKSLGMPVSFDDGVIIGEGTIGGQTIYIAAQEPGFMGGAVGEVHGAKLTGLLERSAIRKPAAVVLLFDTGGVRLHEANAGLIAISEIQRAMFNARKAGVPLIVVSAGANGVYGGIGIISRCCDYIVITEEGRLSVSGPEVIESQKGVEEFDARDRALVWRTMGGKHRYLIDEAQTFVKDSVEDIRNALLPYFKKPIPINLDSVIDEHQQLGERLRKYGKANDALDIWKDMGIANPASIPSLDFDAFMKIANQVRENG